MGELQFLELNESFSKRDIEILGLIRAGLSNQEIAQALFLSLATIKWYNHQIFDKLGVSNRIQAIQKAVALGLFKDQSTLPAKDIAKPRHNLPTALDSFIGRQNEITALLSLLSMQRLVTLTGPGGVGKTRLALQIGWELCEFFADGVFFVNLAATHEPNLVMHAIATTLGLHDVPGRSMLGLLSHEPPLAIIIQHYQAALRQQMDRVDLEQARQAGLQMSLEEALDYGMEMVGAKELRYY